MGNFSRPNLIKRTVQPYGVRTFVYFQPDQILKTPSDYLVDIIIIKSETRIEQALLSGQALADADLGPARNNIYDIFFLTKAAYGRGSATSNIQPFINSSGQLYPTASNPSRPPRPTSDSLPIKILPAFGHTQGLAEYGQPIAESGQIYPQFISSCDKVRDWILPAETTVVQSPQTFSELTYVSLLAVDAGAVAIETNFANLKVSKRLPAQKVSLSILGFDLYYIDPNAPFISAEPLIESTVGESAQLKRTMIMLAGSLVQSTTGQDSILDESVYFRDWAIQTYKWDRDFSVDWWAD